MLIGVVSIPVVTGSPQFQGSTTGGGMLRVAENLFCKHPALYFFFTDGPWALLYFWRCPHHHYQAMLGWVEQGRGQVHPFIPPLYSI